MSRNLSQIAAELLARPLEGRELSDQIQRLGLEIRLVVQSEDTLFGRFRGVLESLRTIVPDEKQRFQAALQAVSLSTKLSRQEILKAMNAQLEELKIVESGLMNARSGWRDGPNGIDARSQQLKGELAHLRERLAQLETEDRTVTARMAARNSDLLLAEKTGKGLFADIAAEIGAVRKQLEALTTEVAPAHPAQPAPMTAPPARSADQPVLPAAQPGPKKGPQKIDAPGKKKEVGQKVAAKVASPQQDTKFRRACPLCGGAFNLLQLEKKWQCFTCAHEEPATDAVPGEEKGEPAGAPPAAAPEQTAETASSSGEPTAAVKSAAGPKKASGVRKKTCPVCFKKMVWSPGEKVWRCPAGHHERK